MLAIKGAANGRGTMIRPDNFVQQMVAAENLIEQQAGIGICVPVKMKIKSPIWGEETIQERKALVEEIKIGIQAVPMIVVPVCQFPLIGFS